MCHSCDEIWYVLYAHNVVDSWCARHVMKFGMICVCNVVDSWYARHVMKYGLICVPIMWWIVGVPDI